MTSATLRSSLPVLPDSAFAAAAASLPRAADAVEQLQRTLAATTLPVLTALIDLLELFGVDPDAQIVLVRDSSTLLVPDRTDPGTAALMDELKINPDPGSELSSLRSAEVAVLGLLQPLSVVPVYWSSFAKMFTADTSSRPVRYRTSLAQLRCAQSDLRR